MSTLLRFKTLAAIAAFCIVFPTFLLSQVIIREKVEINPKPSFKSPLQQTLSTVQPHQAISVKFTWTPSTMFGRLYIFGGACLQGQTYGNGSIELQGVATPKGYSFNIQLRTAELQPGQPFSCSLRATVGNEILFEANSLSFATYPGGIFSGSYPSFSYLPGYSSRFDVFSQADSIYANESAGFRVFEETDCSGTLWQPADSIHFKIIEGDDLGTFVDASNRTLGAEVTMLADDFSANLYQQKVRFIANGPAAMNGGIVTVQGISGEVISTTSFKVNKMTLNLLVEWAPGELYYGEEAYIRVQTVRPDGVPSPPARTVTYTYSILTGNSCAFLFRGATESDTITAPNFSGQGTIGIRARQDSVAAVTPVQVRVTPSDGTISPANVTLNIVPSPLLILVSPTARYGDTLQVEVRRKQSSNDTVGIPLASNAFIGYQIFRSLNAGYFTTLDGSKAGDEIYGENRKALFIAAEESPQPDSVQVQFAVTVLDEGSGPVSGLRLPLAGVGKIIIKKSQKQLKIVNHGPWEIWPYLPPQSNGDSRGADRPGYNPKRSFSILVKDNRDSVLRNEQVSIFTKYEEGSGGHGHGGYADTTGTVPAAKAMPDSLQGLFYRKGVGRNPLIITTDENGVAVVDSFRASEASGKYLVTARLVSDTTIVDTVNLRVKVPGLVDFGTGDYWSLTGTTSKRGQNHLSNHWCTQGMMDSIKAVLKDFHDWSFTKKGGGKAIKLGLNDMSLEWGGVFDIPGTWGFNNQHSFHRIGQSVDIDRSGMTPDQLEHLTNLVQNQRGIRNSEQPQIHYGFDGGN